MLEVKTIVALVTAPINQNLAIVRISGPAAYSLVSPIFDRSLNQNRQQNPQLIWGKIRENQEVLDQVLLLCFFKPRSFTGEDTIEISCHGNLFVVNRILRLLLKQGAVLAEPGDFSKQAFFNGKLNLIQAQAINDLIRAPTLLASKLALHNLSNSSQKELSKLEKEILAIIATVEVNIDYPEYDGVEYLTGQEALKRLSKLGKKTQQILATARQANLYQQGIRIAIIGKPNVGKSTLLNALLQEEKAIVSPWAGTTRDVVEGFYDFQGLPLLLFDTAGIRSTKNPIEKIGVIRSQKVLKKAELVFFLLDNSQIWNFEDNQIWQLVKTKKTLVVVNKIDQPKKLELPSFIPSSQTVYIKAKKGEIEPLKNKLKTWFKDESLMLSPYPFLSHSWQQAKFEEINQRIQQIIQALEEKIPLDVVSSDLKIVFRLFQELSGKDYQENLLDILFSQFCLGK